VPHVGQVPWVAGFPSFIVMGLGSFISRLVRHFIQYASTISLLILASFILILNDILVYPGDVNISRGLSSTISYLAEHTMVLCL